MTDRPTAVFKLPHSTVEWWPWGARTVFTDDTFVHAEPQTDAEYRERALRHGYGWAGDQAALRMCQDHELTHALLAEFLGRPSPVMWGLAHPDEPGPSGREAGWEEKLVLSFQEYVNRWCRGS